MTRLPRSMRSALVVLIPAFALLGCQSTPPVAPAAAITGFSMPESVLVRGDRLYVSNLGSKLEPTAKDGDGFISVLDASGKPLSQRAMPLPGDAPLHAPKGMAAVGDRLYVADIDRVVGFELPGGRRVFDAPVGGDAPAMLNDLAVEDAHTLLVTDTLRGTLQRLDLRSGRFTPVAAGIPGANGLVVDAPAHVAWVVGLGAHFEGGDLFRVPLASAPAVPQRVERGPHGVLDGIVRLADGRMIASDWVRVDAPTPGLLWLLRPEGTVIRPLPAPVALHGPADIALDEAGSRLWVPAMLDQQVRALALPVDRP